jgi:two-component system response regulator
MPTTIDILVVDDNLDDLELTLRVLRQHPHASDIKVAHDGAEALALLLGEQGAAVLKGRPKLILLDLKLPKVGGLEVLRRLKSEPATRCLPIVGFSSSTEERDVIESYRLGINSYITKPVDFTRFSEVVRQISTYWLALNQACPCS